MNADLDFILCCILGIIWLWTFPKLLFHFGLFQRKKMKSTLKTKYSPIRIINAEEISLLEENNNEIDHEIMRVINSDVIVEYNPLLRTGIAVKSSLSWVKVHIILALLFILFLFFGLLNVIELINGY
eukprot:378918_1